MDAFQRKDIQSVYDTCLKDAVCSKRKIEDSMKSSYLGTNPTKAKKVKLNSSIIKPVFLKRGYENKEGIHICSYALHHTPIPVSENEDFFFIWLTVFGKASSEEDELFNFDAKIDFGKRVVHFFRNYDYKKEVQGIGGNGVGGFHVELQIPVEFKYDPNNFKFKRLTDWKLPFHTFEWKLPRNVNLGRRIPNQCLLNMLRFEQN